MNLEDKKKDISLILKMNQTFDLTKIAEAKKVYTYVQTKKPFRTQVGTVFEMRLQRLANGGSQGFPCLFCKADNAPNGVICQDCIDKLTGKSRKTEIKAQEPALSLDSLSERAISTTHSIADKTEKAFSFYKGLSKKNKIIAASIGVVIFLLLLAGVETSVTESTTSTAAANTAATNRTATSKAASVTISDLDSAQKYLESLLPEGNTIVRGAGHLTAIPKQIFEIEVGETIEWGYEAYKTYGYDNKTPAYNFAVSNSPEIYFYFVSEDGKILICNPGDNVYLRVL